jgi:hypothetical protein
MFNKLKIRKSICNIKDCRYWGVLRTNEIYCKLTDTRGNFRLECKPDFCPYKEVPPQFPKALDFNVIMQCKDSKIYKKPWYWED